MNSEKPPSRKVAAALYKLAGHTWPQAAKLAGYSPSYSAKAARLADDPEVAAIIEQGHAELRKQAMYDAEALVKECDALILFGREKGNPMSCVKALELKAKALGLLTEKIEVSAGPNIVEALAQAKQRAARVVNAPALALPVSDAVDPFAD